jgi:poly-gamma-glutamate synthesis protein (capsule biosynthesis protein)
MKNRNIKIVFLILLVSGLLYFILNFFCFEKEISLNEGEKDEQVILSDIGEQKKENLNNSEVNLFFVGDIMLDRGVEDKIDKYGNGDFNFPFLKITDELKKSDLLFGNLEGPISDNGLRVGGTYCFRFEPKAIEGLVYAGFDVLSLANNHMLDYQGIALEDTMRILKENDIDYVGSGFNKEEAFSLKIKEINDTKIGFLAYTSLGPRSWRAGEEYTGMSWIDYKDISEVLEKVKESKEIVDILIVSLHSGKEYSEGPTSFQVSFAQSCIDSGANLIIGHHPHVVLGVEEYSPSLDASDEQSKNGWIAYSLGNFIFDQAFSERTMESTILKVKVRNKKIEEVFSEKLKLNQYFQPEMSD